MYSTFYMENIVSTRNLSTRLLKKYEGLKYFNTENRNDLHTV